MAGGAGHFLLTPIHHKCADGLIDRNQNVEFDHKERSPKLIPIDVSFVSCFQFANERQGRKMSELISRKDLL